MYSWITQYITAALRQFYKQFFGTVKQSKAESLNTIQLLYTKQYTAAAVPYTNVQLADLVV